ncbi:hypothetical protein AO940_29640 [Pseudomonas aeruginosa]|nr:hypothetical protein AN920_16945 [Pseudomonas paraeruginosa]OPD81801.1 hypothetical protein AO940_29640 [Pseudomonas aeruginosa]OPE35015.1 hypothetical protein APB45_30285 [Pseudomonas aeruginosa]PHJ29642.1 hypothetical protein CDG78_24495 [Pseudomonas paraeruginosa]RPV02960.1 hypothetical protein IPC878_22975 [Pseudomonas aeruginosa]
MERRSKGEVGEGHGRYPIIEIVMSLGLRRFPEGSGERFRQSGTACTGGSDGERLVEKSSIR